MAPNALSSVLVYLSLLQTAFQFELGLIGLPLKLDNNRRIVQDQIDTSLPDVGLEAYG